MSTALEALFAARVYADGRALRRTTLRHVHLANPPLGIVIWRLGGERFRAAAIAWGPIGGEFQLAVPGEPRNRDLYFAALRPFAADLCAHMRQTSFPRETRQRGTALEEVPLDAPQIVVPNKATVSALSLLGRYLAYLSDRGGVAPDPVLMEAGRHLRFFARNARVPGQSLLVPLDRVVADHWATLLSPFEQANLAALDAQISPPVSGDHPFVASSAAEASSLIGPEPTEEVDRITEGLLAAFNAARGARTDPSVVEGLIGPLRSHYQGLVSPVWALMERVVARERAVPAAPSVARRFGADREAFGRHVDWVLPGGLYRTTDTPRQAAITLRRLEDALAHYEADRAVDDPACMIPYLLDGEAIRGYVSSLAEKKVVVKVRAVRRAVIEVDSPDPVTLPTGKLLWWTATASDRPWRVESVAALGAGSRVTLMLTAAPTLARLPEVGAVITLSTLFTGRSSFSLPPPVEPPWTHTPDVPPIEGEPIDAGDSEPPVSAVDAADVADPGRYT